MGRKKSVPSYCHHRGKNLAYVTVNGREHYLGRYGSPESRRAYAELIARLEAGAEAAPAAPLTVASLVARYDDFASAYYVKAGEPTRQLERVRRSLGVVVRLYGSTPAGDFGPLALEAVRRSMVSLDWSRKHVNSCVGCVRRCWRWAASRQLVPAACVAALATLDGLRAGRTEARETAPVAPVPDALVEATLPHLRPETADMVRLQRLTGMRAGEVCALVADEIDRTGDVWTWTYGGHKQAHRGAVRVVFFGPRAQAILLPHCEAIGWRGFVFSPRRVMERLYEESRKRAPAVRKQCASRAPGLCYTSNSYQKAVRTACDAAGVARWSSHQLRHANATDVRTRHGIEAAQAVLGHARVETSQLYAEKLLGLAAEVARRCG